MTLISYCRSKNTTRKLITLLGGLQAKMGQVGSWLKRDLLGMISSLVLAFFVFIAIFGPALAPYGPFENVYRSDGRLARLEPPSVQFPLGTNNLGQDILSQILYGARVTVFVGTVAALVSVAIGTTIGLVAGYYGGLLDQTLMRFADVAHSIPFLPLAIIWVAISGPNILNIIAIICLFLWRLTARVVRSQVLTLKERPFILAAKAAGASDAWIIFFHLLPNVLPLASLYVAFAAAWAILMEADLSFLGFGDPRYTSWGQMLKSAFVAGAMRTAWWWVIPPGLALSLLVLSAFLTSRSYEEAANPRLKEM